MPTTSHIDILTSAARTTAQTGDDNRNPYGFRGIRVIFDVTAGTSGYSITLTIEGKDRTSGKYYTLLAGAAVSSTSTNIYTVFPGATVTSNVSANDTLPDVWRVKVAVADTKSVTYTIGADLLP